MASRPVTLRQIQVKKEEAVADFIFLGSKITEDGGCSREIKRCSLLEGSLWQNLQPIKKQRHCLADRGPYSQSYGFSSSHVAMWDLDPKEGWGLKNWCFQIVVLEKTLENCVDCKEIKQINPRGNQSLIFTGRSDEAPYTLVYCKVCWGFMYVARLPEQTRRIIEKDCDAGKDWKQKEKGWQRMRWLVSLTQWTWIWTDSGIVENRWVNNHCW